MCIRDRYDYAHPIQDALEGITHSLCSIEFENHRPLYDWVINNLGFEHKPHQYEFARLNVTHTVMSKRYLRELVETKKVDGWDDPRMPTISGLRRRGYTPSAINEFVKKAGVAKAYSIVDIGLLEHCIRDELNTNAQRRVAVLRPIKVVITNYPEDKKEYFELPNIPKNDEAGVRKVPFTREPVSYTHLDVYKRQPFTLQIFFAILAGALLGSKRGFISVGVYVLLGLCGLPVFTKGAGLSYIFQPTFGYLAGFILGAWVCGKVIELRKDYSFKTMLLGCFAGAGTDFAIGVVYFYAIMNLYLGKGMSLWAVLYSTLSLIHIFPFRRPPPLSGQAEPARCFFNKTFGEWSAATFSGAMDAKPVLSRKRNIALLLRRKDGWFTQTSECVNMSERRVMKL